MIFWKLIREVVQVDNENLWKNQEVMEKENNVLRGEIKDLKVRIDEVSKDLSCMFSKFSKNDEKLQKIDIISKNGLFKRRTW